MGTWSEGILDNDTALDGLGDLAQEIVEDIEALAAKKPTPASTAKLGAAVGVLLQLSAYELGMDSPAGKAIVRALEAHSANIAQLPPAARKVLEQVMAGEGRALAERPAKMSAKQVALLKTGKDAPPPFGKREPALFAAKPAAAYVQEVARRCMEAVTEDFEDEATWSDLCREGVGISSLAVLTVLEPCRVSVAKLERWRRCALKGLLVLQRTPDDELPFHQKYYANLDKVLAMLIRRFTVDT